jgi:hypothetical protein
MFGRVQIFKLDASRGRQKNSAGCGLAPTAARRAVTNRDVGSDSARKVPLYGTGLRLNACLRRRFRRGNALVFERRQVIVRVGRRRDGPRDEVMACASSMPRGPNKTGLTLIFTLIFPLIFTTKRLSERLSERLGYLLHRLRLTAVGDPCRAVLLGALDLGIVCHGFRPCFGTGGASDTPVFGLDDALAVGQARRHPHASGW